MPRVKEETAIVLDFLKHGYPEDSHSFHRADSIIQALGEKHFILFELIPREGISVKQHDKIYIGDGEREQIKFIKGTINYDKLTQSSKTELPYLLKKLVEEQESRFMQFFNFAGPISLRAHSLELLPGIGKKHTRQILDERARKPFENFIEFKQRVSSVPMPKTAIVNRIIEELKGNDRHRIFVGV